MKEKVVIYSNNRTKAKEQLFNLVGDNAYCKFLQNPHETIIETDRVIYRTAHSPAQLRGLRVDHIWVDMEAVINGEVIHKYVVSALKPNRLWENHNAYPITLYDYERRETL